MVVKHIIYEYGKFLCCKIHDIQSSYFPPMLKLQTRQKDRPVPYVPAANFSIFTYSCTAIFFQRILVVLITR